MSAGEDTPGRILLGEITGVHGIKGDVVIRSFTADPEDIGSYGALSNAEGDRTFEVVPIRAGPKGVVVRIVGIEDRTSAEALRGIKLYVDRLALPEPEDDAFYFTDLVGLKAIADDGRAFGRIVAVHNFGAGDIIEVAIDGQPGSELIPFTNDSVPEVDIAGGQARVVLPASIETEDPRAANENEKGE